MYKNNLIAENKIIITTSDNLFKIFCRCNATVSDLYDGKRKNKIAVVYFSNFHDCNIGYCTRKLIVRLKFSPALSIYMIF